MKPAGIVAAVIGLGTSVLCTPASASQQVYTYSVIHPVYGEIGTFTDTIDCTADLTRIDTHLRVAVRVLGIVAYREESDSTEVLQGNRLVTLLSSTNKDGTHLEVRGQAEGEHFLVNASYGNFAAPADVAPSDPWLLKHTGIGIVVSTATGKLVNIRVSGGEEALINVHGVDVETRHFLIAGDKRQEVWLDSHDIPVMFRTMEHGTPIDFVLKTPISDAAIALAAATPSAPLHAEEDR
ncbi:MAG TPA: DUF6134 family protein [Stellaceae bacterium]|nr:DUF6134 family protein [Stellaceae bacterium]